MNDNLADIAAFTTQRDMTQVTDMSAFYQSLLDPQSPQEPSTKRKRQDIAYHFENMMDDHFKMQAMWNRLISMEGFEQDWSKNFLTITKNVIKDIEKLVNDRLTDSNIRDSELARLDRIKFKFLYALIQSKLRMKYNFVF